MKKGIFTAVYVAATLLGQTLLAQDARVKEQLFAAVDKKMAQAQIRHAAVLAPTSYEKGAKAYEKASSDFDRGYSLDGIRKNLAEASDHFDRALEALRLAEVTFSEVLAARQDAISAEALTYAENLWQQAEERLRKAAAILEEGDVNDAKKNGTKAEALYRQAELEAIKANFLAPAWRLLEHAKRLKVEKRAPKTLARAQEYAAQAEALLQQNRYDNDEARLLAQQAKAEAQHALYLQAQIERFMERGYSLEDIFLAFENPLKKIAGNLDIAMGFENGIEPIVNSILERVAQTQDSLQRASETLDAREREIDNIQAQLASMESRLGTLSATERALKRKLQLQRGREDVFNQIAGTFSRSEAQVLRSGDYIIIRLYGLTFPVGEATIRPEFFQLLTKTQEAIRRVPNGSVVIQGHTDARGSDQANQVLSEKRAAAVREYLIANMGFPENRIVSVGYGESKPIARNDTPHGRAVNRRIEIVLIPEWATN